MKRVLIALLLIAMVGLFGWTGYYLYSKDQDKPVIYNTEAPIYTDIIKKTVATGSVVPRKEIEIKPQVSGLIDKLYVEPGDLVKKGDLIATIQIVPNMASLASAENRVKVAELNLRNAEQDYERNKPLFEEGVIAAATFQNFQLAYETAQQELQAAEDNLEIIRKGATQRSGRTANTNARATISGMVLDVPVEEGNSVIEANTFNDGTTIAIVANMEEMIFEGKVDESEVGKIREGMDLVLTVGAIEGETFAATLEHIAPKGVEENGAIQFEIRAEVNLTEDQFIRAGYSANASIVLDRRDSVLAISETLLIFEGEDTFVEVERGEQQFEKIPVKTGLSDGINIEILDGIEPDMKIKNPNPPLDE
ncbi:MAG: efflux RND transporter periplasmic adaptor subunit [Bacteroidetes bacterium]|nr:MAG: efflux RND transporter periplasmic adaptor subunit [Bacteroidota bacterium]